MDCEELWHLTSPSEPASQLCCCYASSSSSFSASFISCPGCLFPSFFSFSFPSLHSPSGLPLSRPPPLPLLPFPTPLFLPHLLPPHLAPLRNPLPLSTSPIPHPLLLILGGEARCVVADFYVRFIEPHACAGQALTSSIVTKVNRTRHWPRFLTA